MIIIIVIVVAVVSWFFSIISFYFVLIIIEIWLNRRAAQRRNKCPSKIEILRMLLLLWKYPLVHSNDAYMNTHARARAFACTYTYTRYFYRQCDHFHCLFNETRSKDIRSHDITRRLLWWFCLNVNSSFKSKRISGKRKITTFFRSNWKILYASIIIIQYVPWIEWPNLP